MALLGEKWRQNYGRDIDYLHFHNYLEIGYCHEGKGAMVIGDDEYYFEGEGELTVIPSNYLHTTNSDPGNIRCGADAEQDGSRITEVRRADAAPGQPEGDFY